VVFEVRHVALDAEVQQERGGRVRPRLPVLVAVLALVFREQLLFGVGVVGVGDDQIRVR